MPSLDDININTTIVVVVAATIGLYMVYMMEMNQRRQLREIAGIREDLHLYATEVAGAGSADEEDTADEAEGEEVTPDVTEDEEGNE